MTGDGPERIAALIERIGRLLRTDAHAGGLLPVQWEALRYLGRANRFSRTPAALTAYLGLTKGTVSQTVHALEARGLVTKQVDPVDRRGRRLSLSPAGRTLLMRDPIVETVTAIRRLSGPQRAEIARGLESMLSSRLDARQRKPFGQCRDCRHFARRHFARRHADGAPHYCRLLDEPLTEQEKNEICHEQQPAA